MKQALLLFLAAACLSACNNSDKTEAGKDAKSDTLVAAASDTKMDYAYTIDHPDNWQTGSRENTKMVLASLKAFENGDIPTAMKDFTDTVTLNFDNLEARITRDSATKMFVKERATMKSMKIDMDDFESVKSKDGTHEYVSLWYKQHWQDNKGKWDSLSVMDDLRIVNGKIASIDEKTRHYAKKK